MSIVEDLAFAGIEHGWRLMLAFTVALVVVAVLRPPCRRLFGAERAFQLWALPPLAMLISQLPHPGTLSTVALPPVLYTVTSATAAVRSQAVGAPRLDWHVVIALLWLAGVVARLLAAGIAQSRYHRQLAHATVLDRQEARWPVLRSHRVDVGPALVGAWRPRIVVPSDFQARYDTVEQGLILAHETVHGERRDGCWSLLAHLLAALCWWHPMTPWALSALRRDQEIACDAAVLRKLAPSLHAYAKAMLKTQVGVFALPVGCPWSVHPVVERIKMLNLPTPSPLRRLAGGCAIGLAALAASAAIYATQPAAPSYHASTDAAKEALALSDGARTAVAAYWFGHAHRMPANNTAARLLEDPDRINGKFVRRVAVHDGVIVATLRARPGSSSTAGSLRLVPHPDPARRLLPWSCESPDIPAIASLASGCVYRPVSGPLSAAHTLKLELGVEGQPARLHATACLRPGQYYQTIQGGIDPLPPWHARFTVSPAAGGMLQIEAQISGGSLDRVVYPKLLTRPDQQAVIEIGQQVRSPTGITGNHTLRAALTPSVGC